MAPLEQETATYRAKLPELLGRAGRFVLIRGDAILDLFDAHADARQAGQADLRRQAKSSLLIF
ncbi:hypothetical protein [Methylobacterium nonmethylotrophicum]|uniref:Uncharacterized protein n=1 Tax=Methylobacterium nonmethylotrophicum TaxID=1141884 RepID=A0A4Z0NZY8_9HYPH|nr:hypothetical protein [Methylobacterium nonmethylotrophicum]TGE02463.1 hypothetical protein EU555_01460 [Methylobacterium nonmethylotrophicum]